MILAPDLLRTRSQPKAAFGCLDPRVSLDMPNFLMRLAPADATADRERDDVSKWPQGNYRRAFVREYAAAIALSAEVVVAEFLELFPDLRRRRGAAKAQRQPWRVPTSSGS